MEYFIGVNGVQSGPFSAAVVREKQVRGEIPPDALCWTEGWPDWRPFSTAFPPPLPRSTPPPPPLPPSAYQPPASPFVQAPGQTPRTSGLSIVSLVFGVLGLVLFIPSLAAVICGHIACSDIKRSQGAQTGRGLAIVGLVLGYISLSIVPIGILAAMAIPAFQKVRVTSQEKTITNNLRMIASAADQYMLEHGAAQVAYTQLVGHGPEHYIPPLIPVAGEDYTPLVVRLDDREIAVVTADGRTITHSRYYTGDLPSFSTP